MKSHRSSQRRLRPRRRAVFPLTFILAAALGWPGPWIRPAASATTGQDSTRAEITLGATTGQDSTRAEITPSEITRAEMTPGEITPGEITLGPESPLEDFLRVAALNNPGLKASYENWMAQMGLAAKAGGWPDPVISYGYYLQSVETAIGPQQHRLALSQAIPWFGKLSARGGAAEQAALAAEAKFHAARLALFSRVARAYYEYAFLSEAITFTRENLDLMKVQEGVVRSLYRTQSATYNDLIKSQVELGTLQDRLSTLRDRRAVAAARLNATLGRTPGFELPWPLKLRQPDFELPPEAEVRNSLLAHNPDLESFDHQLASVDERITAAQRDGWPDFTVGVQTILTGQSDLTSFPGQGKDAWIATVAMKLPLWRGKYRGEQDAARARRRQTEHARHDHRLKLLAQSENLLFQLRDADRKIDLYGENLLPMARQSLRAAATAFQTGEARFLDVLDAQRTLLRFELDYSRAQADRGEHIVQLAELMGTPLVETENPARDQPDTATTPSTNEGESR